MREHNCPHVQGCKGSSQLSLGRWRLTFHRLLSDLPLAGRTTPSAAPSPPDSYSPPFHSSGCRRFHTPGPRGSTPCSPCWPPSSNATSLPSGSQCPSLAWASSP